MDHFKQGQFEAKLAEIYQKSSWLRYEIALTDFINLFPVHYRNGRPLKPERPAEFELDRETFLAIMVAFRFSFN